MDHRIAELATTPGSDNLAEVLRLLAKAPDRYVDRRVASMLASCHEPRDLVTAFAGPASQELRACLAQELVLRGVAVHGLPGVKALRHHPLGWLPLTVFTVEEHADLPNYNRGGTGGSHVIPYVAANGVLPRTTAGPVPAAVETTTDDERDAITAVVRDLVEESNGEVEARVFSLTEPLGDYAIPSLLTALDLDCVTGAIRLAVEPCAPRLAWSYLFAAASMGGAYTSGAYGAYGRLYAWQSMAGLVGAPAGATAAEVDASVNACSWFAFTSDAEFYWHVAWDFGLLCRSPDGRRMALLAMSDSD